MANNPAPKLIVGLGNPGAEYADTRHNAGAWWLSLLAKQQQLGFKPQNKFHGQVADYRYQGEMIRLLLPSTYMNQSGQAVGLISQFYKIPAQQILIVHDELDLPTGQVRVKIGGGDGGHNGLKDIANRLASKQFSRLRIGIGRPRSGQSVINYVLGKPSNSERQLISQAIDESLCFADQLCSGAWDQAMQQLHRYP